MSRHRSNPPSTAPQNKRLSVNLVSFLATCVIIFVAVSVTDAGFANSIDRITKNLDVALRDLMDDMPKYSNYTETEKFGTSATFNPRGMTGLYNLTTKFMDLILPSNELLMDGLIVVRRDGPDFGQIEYTELLKHYWVVLLVFLILLLIGLLLPICGLFFCCCRCCGKCGARSQPCDKKRDLCKKILQGALLIILGTALLFCVVCAFASNQQLQDGIDELPENFRKSQKDTNAYLESTKKQAHHLLVVNYQEFALIFNKTMNKSSEYVMQQLEILSNATAMMDLYTFVNNIPKINISLDTLKTDTNSLRASASQLNDAMRKVKKDLLNTLEKCAQLTHLPECANIKNNISQLQTNIDFNKLPDVSPTINKLNELDITSLHQAAKEGKERLSNIEVEIKSKLDVTLQDAVKKVNEAGETIKENLHNITQVITDIQKEFNTNMNSVIKDVIDPVVKKGGPYRYYPALAISCIILLVTICIALGLICGICGKRPDGYSDNCCNKGAGSQFLICAVMLMFIFGLVVAAIGVATFLLGIVSDKIGCYPLRNPENSKVTDLLNKYLQLNDKDIDVGKMVTKCYHNESIYNTLDLKKQFDIDTIHQRFNISSVLDSMNSQLEGILGKDFTILNTENEKTLENLLDFDPSINFDQFQDELKQNFTNLSLKEISKKLEELVDAITDDPKLHDIRTEVQLSILHVNTYEEKLLVPMKDMANRVIGIAQRLEIDLKMNSSSFSEAVHKLLTEIKEAQTLLQVNGTGILQSVATEFGEMVMNQVNSYLYRVANVTKNELGQCGPMNVVINSTITFTCDRVILAWNGFSFSLLLSLLLFVPTIIVAVKLASLYQKYKQYGQYVETRCAKRGKKKPKKAKNYEDRPQNMGGEVVAREYATGSHPPDTRYSDMAPKFETADHKLTRNWEEFPNGGPPQYQRAPTEYERPPPYYYPGTGDQ